VIALNLLLAVLFWPLALLGLFLVILWVRFMKQPGIDSSNIFNPLRFTWFALTRPDKFLEVCPWLADDEWDNVNGNITRKDN